MELVSRISAHLHGIAARRFARGSRAGELRRVRGDVVLGHVPQRALRERCVVLGLGWCRLGRLVFSAVPRLFG